MKKTKIVSISLIVILILLLCLGHFKYRSNLQNIYISKYTSTNEMADKSELNAYLYALHSNDFYKQYIAINKLVESYNHESLKKKSINEIKTFLESEDLRLKKSAEFITAIFKNEWDTIESDYIIKLKDDSIIFTIGNELSEYGSFNTLYQIKDNNLSIYESLDNPHKYIKQINASSSGDIIYVLTQSNKSNYLFLINPIHSTSSPEIISSIKTQYAIENNI